MIPKTINGSAMVGRAEAGIRHLAPSLLLILLLGLSGTAAWAGGEIHPRLRVMEEFNDNIFLVDEGREGDFITTVEPGISLLWETSPLELTLDYALRYRKYWDLDQLDETKLKDIQRARGEAVFFPERPFTITVFEEYSRTAIDLRDPVVAENDVVNKTNRNLFLVNPTYRLKGRTWTTTLGYQFEMVTYDAEGTEDSRAHQVSLELVDAVTARTTLFATLSGEDRDFEVRQDYRRADGLAGIAWRPSPRLGFKVSGGVGWIDFQPGDADQERSDDDELVTLWRVEGDWQLRPSLGLSGSYSESVELSVDEGLFEQRAAEATLTLKKKGAITLLGYHREDEYVQGDRLDRIIGGGMELSFPLGRVLSLRQEADLERAVFRPGPEKVWRYGVSAAIEWAYSRFTAEIGYAFRAEDSNIEGNGYRNNIYFAQAGVEF